MKSILLAALAIYFCVPLSTARADVWVDYQFSEYHRATQSDPWQLIYSAPFGVRMPYGAGFISRDDKLTDPSEPNCFSFTFTPTSTDGLKFLTQTLEATKFAGDIFCTPRDEKKIIAMGMVEMTITQGKTTTVFLPYLGGKEVKYELSQSWKIVP